MYGVLPTPLEDEPVYSIVARLHLLLGKPYSRLILKAAFGERRRPEFIDVHLPTSLNFFADQFARGFLGTPDTILHRHTSFPYLARFAMPEDHQSLRQALTWGREAIDSTKRFVAMSPIISHRTLAFCPACVTADEQAWGMPGFHRVHQLPGVFVCPWHKLTLREDRGTNGRCYDLVSCPFDPLAGREVFNPFDKETSVWVAEGSLWLLGGEVLEPQLDRVRWKIRALLDSRGWIEANERSTWRFWDAYSSRVIWRPEAQLTGRDLGTKLIRLIVRGGPGFGHLPLSLLLMLKTLDISPKDFFAPVALDA